MNTNRYGFNGKENDNEVKGEGNQIDFGARVYDPRAGKWFSRDAYSKEYPSLSPYNFVANNPIQFIDPDGNKITDPKGNVAVLIGKDGQIQFTKFATNDIKTVVGLMSKTEVGNSVLKNMVKTHHNIEIHIDDKAVHYYDRVTKKISSTKGEKSTVLGGYTFMTIEGGDKLVHAKVVVYKKSLEHIQNEKWTFLRDGQNFNSTDYSVEELMGGMGVHEGVHSYDPKSQGFRKGILDAEEQPRKQEAQYYRQLDLQKVPQASKDESVVQKPEEKKDSSSLPKEK